MLSVDANLLLYSFTADAPEHQAARQFIESLSSREDVALSEFVLTELYLLLRNPAVLARPLSAPGAMEIHSGLPPSPALESPRLPTCKP